ncbi:MAG: T9SS type A sorting domain-containing protein [Bacteroidetes bacterium]|nr:T9SS type A sorting domain-containing protein [Bacteroidota bacterium]
MKKFAPLFCFVVLEVSQACAQFFALNFDSSRYYSALLPYPNDGNYRVLQYYSSANTSTAPYSQGNYYGNYYSGTPTAYTAVPVPRSVIKVYDTNHNLLNTIALPRGLWLHENPPLKANNDKGGTRLLWSCLYTDTLNPVNAKSRLAVLELDAVNYNVIGIHPVSHQTQLGDFVPTGIVAMPNNHYIVGGATHITDISGNVNLTKCVTRFYKLDIHLNKYDSADIAENIDLSPYNSYNTTARIKLETGLVYDNKFAITGNVTTTCSAINGTLGGGTFGGWIDQDMSHKIVLDTGLNIVDCLLMNEMKENNCAAFANRHELTNGKAVRFSSAKTYLTGDGSEACGYMNGGNMPQPNAHAYGVAVNSVFGNANENIQTNISTNYVATTAPAYTYANTYYPTGYNTTYAIKQAYIITVAVEGLEPSRGHHEMYPNLQGVFNRYYFLPPSCNIGAIHSSPNATNATALTNISKYNSYLSNSKLLITKMDTLGNIIWTKRYGGEMTYFGRGIAFTNDGGCIISGCRYDSTSMYAGHLVENFLLKLDEHGNIHVDTNSTGGGIGITKLNAEHLQLKIYPNPANTEIYIDVPNESNFDIEIYNTLGQLVLQKNNYTNRSAINISTLNKNVYYLKAKSNKGVYYGKVLKE